MLQEKQTVQQNQFMWLKPYNMLKLSQLIIQILSPLFIFLFSISLWLGIMFISEDFQQGENFKMIYIHVPFAWSCMINFIFLSFTSIIYLYSNHPILNILNRSYSVLGTLFTFNCLITGSFWGFPTWGTFWVWDARLTSVLILFFIYATHLLLIILKKDRIASIFSLVGLINLPIIKYSVDWWSTLHQGASLTESANTIHESIFTPMIIMFIALLLFSLLYSSIIIRLFLVKYRYKTFI